MSALNGTIGNAKYKSAYTWNNIPFRPVLFGMRRVLNLVGGATVTNLPPGQKSCRFHRALLESYW
jgi:hypothetical protein